MDGDSIDSGLDSRHLVNDNLEPDLLSELERESHGGSRPGGGASAQGSVQSRGPFRVPSIIGGVSAGSRSIIRTGNYFDDTIQRSSWMVLARKVVCPKGKRGDQGSCDYSWHHLAATAAIPELFGAAKHFCTKKADGELSYKYKDIQTWIS
jgi:hypothetical protein